MSMRCNATTRENPGLLSGRQGLLLWHAFGKANIAKTQETHLMLIT